MGWRPVEGRPLELTFQFGGPREFHSVRIHANNRASQGVRVPKTVAVSFSVDGRRWLQRTKLAVVLAAPPAEPSAGSASSAGSAKPTQAAPGATTPSPRPPVPGQAQASPPSHQAVNETAMATVSTPASEEARDLVVPLGGRVAKMVRIELEFAATWILISEVAFDSGTCV